MRPATLRVALRLAGVAGIPGIIAGSIAGNDGVAITFGSVTAVAAFGLIVLTAATGGSGGSPEPLGQSVERRVERLVADGADERAVRDLVAEAVRMGQVLPKP